MASDDNAGRGYSVEQRLDDLLRDANSALHAGHADIAHTLAGAALVLAPTDERARELLSTSDLQRSSRGARRQMTILFADLVGSTALSERADPELLRDLIRAYQRACELAVEEFGGHLADYLGDGVVAYFGHPVAHEDDAQRAVKAALRIRDAMVDVSADTEARHGQRLDVRIAVHTGLVLRTDLGASGTRKRDAVVGQTPNIAARLQAATAPNTVVISAATEALVRGYFVVKPLGPLELAGISAPVDAFEVQGASGATTRIEAASRLTPFVGRSAPLAQLTAAVERAAAGGSSAVLVIGDPGVGKSRLLLVLREQARQLGVRDVPMTTSAYHRATPLYPVRRLFENAYGLAKIDDPRRRLDRLHGGLSDLGLAADLELVATMLALPPSAGYRRPELDGVRLREETLRSIEAWIDASTIAAPVLASLEDLNWADPTTRELMNRVVRRGIGGLCVVATVRPDPELLAFARRLDGVEQLALQPLDDEERAALAHHLQTMVGFDPALTDELVSRSDGVPLFLEELAAAAVAPVRRRSTQLLRYDIPSALQDSLLARLEAPGVDLDLLQIVATIGREVEIGLLGEITGLAGDELDNRLDVLIDAGLLEENEEQTVVRFRHALIREVAYETQLLAERRQRHSSIADALAQHASIGLTSDAAQRGYHLEHAERFTDAVDAYAEAARAAQAAGAHAEATAELTHALELLDHIAEPLARAEREATLRQSRAFSAVSVEGYAAPAAAEDFERCVQLGIESGARERIRPSLRGVWAYYALRGELERADALNAAISERSGPDDVPAALGWALTSFFRGDLERAAAECTTALDSPLAAAAGPPPDWLLPNDPFVPLLAHRGLIRWLTGSTETAFEDLDAAERRSRTMPFPFGPYSLGYTLSVKILVHRLHGSERHRSCIEELRAVAERHGFVFWSLVAAAEAAIDSARDAGPSAFAELSQAIDALRSVGAEVWSPYFLTEQADVLRAHGHATEAIECAARAVDIGTRTGVRYYEAEALRVRGQARLDHGDTAGVDDLRAAVVVARAQHAYALERRASRDLR